MAVMGWGVNYLASSFSLGWGADTSTFFFSDVLKLSDGVGSLGGIAWGVLTGALIAWVALYFCVWKGVRSVSKVVVWTATLPFVILAILLVRAVTLEGAAEGIKLFLVPEWGALLDPQLWMGAFSQVFFSLSLAFGVMVAYGSLKTVKSEITKSVVWVAAGNFIVSIMSGFVVFGTLGYMALQQGVPVTEVVAGGPALAFVTFPMAISLLPALNTLIAVIFFVMVLTLGIDSAFSLLEAFAVAVKDRFKAVSSKKIAFVLCVIGVITGMVFTTHAGLYYLDIVDHFVVSYGLVIAGLLEAIVVGWFWKGDALKKFINEHSDWKIGIGWDFAIKIVAPVFLTILLVLNIITEIKEPYEGYPTWALVYCGLLVIVLAPFVGVVVDKLAPKRD